MNLFRFKAKKEKDYEELGFWPNWALPLPYELEQERKPTLKPTAKRNASKSRKRA